MLHKHEHSELNLSKDYVFMPSIKATLMDDSKLDSFRSKFFDISADGKFDIKDLLPYVYIALNMKIDSKKHSYETEALFRECTWDDFNQFKNKGVPDDLSDSPDV